MFKSNYFIIILVLSTIMLSSCSVAMAARKTGTSLDTVQACRTRGQFLASGATIISSEKLPSGEMIEIYRFQKEKGSTARAFMHGVLDVSTLGIWEAIGTPIESCVNETGYFLLKVIYDCKGVIQRVELM